MAPAIQALEDLVKQSTPHAKALCLCRARAAVVKCLQQAYRRRAAVAGDGAAPTAARPAPAQAADHRDVDAGGQMSISEMVISEDEIAPSLIFVMLFTAADHRPPPPGGEDRSPAGVCVGWVGGWVRACVRACVWLCACAYVCACVRV